MKGKHPIEERDCIYRVTTSSAPGSEKDSRRLWKMESYKRKISAINLLHSRPWKAEQAAITWKLFRIPLP